MQAANQNREAIVYAAVFFPFLSRKLHAAIFKVQIVAEKHRK